MTVWFDIRLVSEETSGESGDWVTERRYRAVLRVLEGVPKAQVAVEFGTSRQSVHSWVVPLSSRRVGQTCRSFAAATTSPNQLAPEVIARICEFRRMYPRWGAQRIAHQLAVRGNGQAPSRSSVYRVFASRTGRGPAAASQAQVSALAARCRCSYVSSTSWVGCSWLPAASASRRPASMTTPDSS